MDYWAGLGKLVLSRHLVLSENDSKGCDLFSECVKFCVKAVITKGVNHKYLCQLFVNDPQELMDYKFRGLFS